MEGLGRGWGQLVVWYRAGALVARFSVTEGVGNGNPRSCCLVSLIDSKLLSPRISQFTSARSPVSYLLLISGYSSCSRLAIANQGMVCSINTPFRCWYTPRTRDMELMMLSPTSNSKQVRYKIAIGRFSLK